MPKDEERKELTQEEIDARDEKFRTFFTTSVAQVPEEMTRRDDGPADKPKGLFGRLFCREKTEPQGDGAAEESSTGEIRLGGEEQEKPSELELVLKLEEETEPSKPETPEPAGAASAPQPEPEKPQVSQPKAPETPAPQPDKKPTEKQSASRKKAVQYGPRTPQEQYEDREMQALKAMLFGPKPQPEAEKPEKSVPEAPAVQKPGPEKEPDAKPERPAAPLPELVFAEDKTAKPHAAPAMHFFGKGEDEETPSAPTRTTPPSSDDSMSLPLIDLNDDGPAPAETPDAEAPAQPAAEEAASAEEAATEAEKTPEAPEQMGDRLRRMSAALTLRCALGGILALVLLHFGLAAEGLVGPLAGLDPVTAPAAFYAARPALLRLGTGRGLARPAGRPAGPAGPSQHGDDARAGRLCRPAAGRCGPAERQELSAVQLHPPVRHRGAGTLPCAAGRPGAAGLGAGRICAGAGHTGAARRVPRQGQGACPGAG